MSITNQILLFALLITTAFSCSTQRHLIPTDQGTLVDQRLIGIWGGSEESTQYIGMTKSWEMTRNANGTFVLDFKVTQHGKKRTVIETGSWWTLDGRFYEYHDASGLIDVYHYEVLNDNQIKFTSRQLTADRDAEVPEETSFIDIRVER